MKRRTQVLSTLPEATISVFTDVSDPLTLKIQLFWFDDLITEFLTRVKSYVTESGPVITLDDSFKYIPVEMEGSTTIHLLGFHSNITAAAYEPLIIKCDTEEEKLRIREEICNAFLELSQASIQQGYPSVRSIRMSVPLGETP
jgi:hypothetical protein